MEKCKNRTVRHVFRQTREGNSDKFVSNSNLEKTKSEMFSPLECSFWSQPPLPYGLRKC